ncbi:MAG: hypothetical protein PHQ35_06190 [Phycisphaerae bacterium]|nr:hypothetical protein [Phycisphaerae bacterium]MDD5381231.1 hypothetical protein [Phycisphaerae bacterium]
MVDLRFSSLILFTALANVLTPVLAKGTYIYLSGGGLGLIIVIVLVCSCFAAR